MAPTRVCRLDVRTIAIEAGVERSAASSVHHDEHRRHGCPQLGIGGPTASADRLPLCHWIGGNPVKGADRRRRCDRQGIKPGRPGRIVISVTILRHPELVGARARRRPARHPIGAGGIARAWTKIRARIARVTAIPIRVAGNAELPGPGARSAIIRRREVLRKERNEIASV